MPRNPVNDQDRDRHSKTGRTDTDKREGGGAHAWGKAGDVGNGNNSVEEGVGGAFLDRVTAAASSGYFKASDATNKLFYVGVTAGLRANQQEGLVCGIWAANTVGESEAVDATDATGDFTSFVRDLEATNPRDNNYANVDGFLSTHSIELDHHSACVFVGKESDAVPTTLLNEGALATGTTIINVGVVTKFELEHLIKSYNVKPWMDKASFDEALASTPSPVVALPSKTTTTAVAEAEGSVDEIDTTTTTTTAAAAEEEEEGETKTAATLSRSSSTGAEDTIAPTYTMSMAAKPKETAVPDVHDMFKIWNDEKCLGAKAPSLASLDIMHYPEGMEPVEEFKYSDKKATVVCYWAKTHKGNYPTLCTWSDMQELDRYKDCVQFIGVARDADQNNVTKYIGKIGQFNETLGAHGITISGGIPLCYDVAHQVNMGFRSTTNLKVVGVDNCFIVNNEGVIMWRSVFNRGAEPSGQFMTQLDHVLAGEPLDMLWAKEPESSEDEADMEDAGADKAQGLKDLMCDDY